MPDLQNFAVTRASPGNLNAPRHTIVGKLMEGATTIADFTGPNAIQWPDVLATLSPEWQDYFAAQVSQSLIAAKNGGAVPAS